MPRIADGLTRSAHPLPVRAGATLGRLDRGEAAPPPLSGDWRTDLAKVARHARATLLRHPWLGLELAGRPALDANSLRRYDLALTAAAALTPDITLAANAVDTVLAYVLGSVARELAERQAQRRSGLTKQQWQASVGSYIRDVIAGGTYPQFARWVLDADDPGPDQRFDFGLMCVLDGLAATVRIARSRFGETPIAAE